MEAPEHRIVDPAVHVDEPDPVQVLVPGEAARGLEWDDGQDRRLPGGLAALAVGVEGQPLGNRAHFVGDGDDGIQVVPVQVAGLLGDLLLFHGLGVDRHRGAGAALLRQRRLCRGPARLHGKAQAGLDRAVRAARSILALPALAPTQQCNIATLTRL